MKLHFVGILSLILSATCSSETATAPAQESKVAPTAAEADASNETPGLAKTAMELAPASSLGSSSAGASPLEDKEKWDASTGDATVSGRITFKGKAPERKTIDMGSDAKCSAHEKALEETIIVTDGGLQNVVISISKGLKGWKFPKGEGAVKLTQKGCVYRPHVLAVQAGQKLEVSNNDNTVHNVHTFSRRNQAFNMAQPAGAAPIKKAMKRKDKLFLVKCDMHDWMKAYVVVFDHPFFTVSDATGAFSLTGLPPGTYTISAQHETLGTQSAEVTLAKGASETLNVVFEPKKADSK
jgi:plastocyanin